MLNNTEKTMEKIVALCKNRGFIFAGSDIYGGLANTWDYGPLGARMKNNVKDTWRKRFIQERRNSYEVDADILMHPRVWEASGHIASFSDPLLDCKECKMRHRADTLIENFDPDAHPDKMTKEEMFEYIKAHSIPCPHCGKHNFTDIREFNLMFQTYRGVTNDAKSVIYLRPENAQGEYVNFLNVQRSMRAKLPFSIGQIGKAFRNEITPGNFTFRTIEFEQMEFQTFCKKGSDNKLYDYFKQFGKKYCEDLGIAPSLPRPREARPLRESRVRHRVPLPVRLGRDKRHPQQNGLRPDETSGIQRPENGLPRSRDKREVHSLYYRIHLRTRQNRTRAALRSI